MSATSFRNIKKKLFMSVKLKIIEKLVRTNPAMDCFVEIDELPNDVTDWSPDWWEEFEERAAIMEFDGNMSRLDAETWAETIVRAAYRLKCKEMETGKGPNDITKKG